MPHKVVIVDYGMGNLNSIRKKLMRLNVVPMVSSHPADIKNADKIILPGVGHFKKAMEHLIELDLIEVLNDVVLIQKKPILGICLGMQLFSNTSEEGNTKGLGWIDAEVEKFKVKDKLKYKIPHIGWNQIEIVKESLLMKDIPNLSEFYFVHSYCLKANNKSDILNTSDFESPFTSAVEKENIFGVQYHPEKSHDIGEILLKNFVTI